MRQPSDYAAAAAARLKRERRWPDEPLAAGAASPSEPPDALRPDDASERPMHVAPWPSPLGAAARCGIVGHFLEVVEPHTEADPAALVLQLLVGFGNAVGRSPHFAVEADAHHLNENVLLIGSTSAGRKGTSLGQAKRPLNDADPTWQRRTKSGLSSGEGLIWEVRDAIEKTELTQTVTVDPGVEDKRLLVVESEFGKVLKVVQREGNTLSPVMREAWDNGTLNTLTKNTPARSTGAHISIIGHVTPDELRRLLDQTDVANGLLNRFLLAAVRRSKCLPDGGALDPRTLVPITDHVRASLEFGRSTGRLIRDGAARALWHEQYPLLTDERPGRIGAVTARSAAHAVRLSCIYALLDFSREVRAQHLLAALEVLRYVEETARFVFGESLGDPTADKILGHLKDSATGLTRSQIYDALGRHVSRDAIADALGMLARQGLASMSTDATTGGRPAEIWAARKARKAQKAPALSVVAPQNTLNTHIALNARPVESRSPLAVADDDGQDTL